MMRTLSLFCIVTILFAFRFPAEPVRTNSTLKSATVYRNGAELIHQANASLNAGNNELIINGLSSYIDLNSIQVNCPAAVTILGIEFNNNFLGEESISPAVRKLTDSLENLQEKIEQVKIQANTTKELLEVLKLNRAIKGEQSGMSVTELSKLMAYYKTTMLQLQNDLLVYNTRKAKLDLAAAKLTSQIEEEKKKNTKSGGRISLQLSVALPGSYDFSISYITQNAYWTPYYDIKAENIKSPLKFIYKAKIAQTTGIDWHKVKLSLSTSAPKHYGTAPIFKTWFLGYIDPVYSINRNLQATNSIQSTLNEVVVTGYSKKKNMVQLRGENSLDVGPDPIYVVNGVIMANANAINVDNIEDVKVLKGNEATAIYGARGANGVIIITLKEGLQDHIRISESELDLSYDIDIPYDVPTNGKAQIATLKEESVPAAYKYYAVPKLDKDAYLLAEIPNWQLLNLLPGEANIIFEGTYIGRSFIDPANTSDTLNLTLGTDKRVVVKREKMTDFSSIKFLGSNKLQTFTYQITVKNNKKEPITLILKDQYPISTNKEIEVELLDHDNGLINREVGVVTWIGSVEPGKSIKKRISYSAKYPKGKTLNL